MAGGGGRELSVARGADTKDKWRESNQTREKLAENETAEARDIKNRARSFSPSTIPETER